MDRDYNKETKERHKRYREMHPDYMGNWYKNNPNYRLEYGRRYRMSRKQKSMEYAINRNYNLSIDQYNKILNYQENKCAICKRPFETTNRHTSPHVDHDHSTGLVRGLLCNRCNMALGHLSDYIDNVNVYLKRNMGD